MTSRPIPRFASQWLIAQDVMTSAGAHPHRFSYERLDAGSIQVRSLENDVGRLYSISTLGWLDAFAADLSARLFD